MVATGVAGWRSSIPSAVAIVGSLVVAVGWFERPGSQYEAQPALDLALVGLAVGIVAIVLGAVASVRTLRHLGLTTLVSVATITAAIGLLVWIAVQPFGCTCEGG